jgi:hypothetical protein
VRKHTIISEAITVTVRIMCIHVKWSDNLIVRGIFTNKSPTIREKVLLSIVIQSNLAIAETEFCDINWVKRGNLITFG